MGMGENQTVDILTLAELGAVAFEGFFALALKETAVKQDFLVVDFYQVLRSGNGPGCPEESDFHSRPLI